MSFNTFGRLFRFTTWGESHGPAIGCVVDGCPPNIPLNEADIQLWLDQRRPGASKLTSQRKEPDTIEILSGVFEGKTTGHPISLLIKNEDARPGDYDEIRGKFRPGHADFTYHAKYGIYDYRGGGRASARETACRVAAGAIARKILGAKVTIRAALVQIGPMTIDRKNFDWDVVAKNILFCPDKEALRPWQEALVKIRKEGDSYGGVVEVEATGLPVGLGAPHYAKLDQDIASAMMSIHASKGVEIGAGFEASSLKGSENADEIRIGNDGPRFLSNNAGGTLGGISTGQPLLARVAFKPTSSILIPQKTIDSSGKETEIITKGRHDPCIAIRAVPVCAAMMACTLADHLLLHRAQCG
ncbi:MAG: chorismate synthase [Proteobacteria bacterium]|nr:chorismate synthase [Pseudomonadota bacterium]